jgi:diguanylate cyclase (GGDEF)-like protein
MKYGRGEMGEMSVLVAGLFFTVAFLCLFAGIYLLYNNVHSWLNRLAFLFAFVSFCWCIGAGKALIATSYTQMLMWRRFAGIGTATFFSFLLHYILILTEREDILKKKGILVFLYLPSAISLYFLVISQTITTQMYQFEHMKIGWVSSVKLSGRIVFVDLYTIIFMVVGLLFLVQWRKRSKERNKMNEANRFFFIYTIAFVIAIITEVVERIGVSSYFQECAPLAILLPLIIICYATKKHDFMKAKNETEALLFLDEFRTKIIKYLGMAFFVGAILHICVQYAYNSNPNVGKMLLFSGILAGFGIAVCLVQQFVKKKELTVIAYGILLAVSIPLITIHYVNSGAVTIWAFPFIIVIATLLFNNATVLMMTATSTIITELYLWIRVPVVAVTIGKTDYFVRIAFFGMAIALIFYINRIYLLRLKQLSEKIKTQDFLSRVSSSIINANYKNLNEKMEDSLKMLCAYTGADRAHICYKTFEDQTKDTGFFCWHNEAGSIEEGMLCDTSITNYPWWKNQVEKVGMIQIPNVEKLPQEALQEKEYLLKQKIKSVVAVPLMSNEKKVGFLRIDFVTSANAWNEEFTEMLKIFGNMLGETNARVISQEQMFQMAYYDQLTNMPNRQLIGKQMSRAITDADQNGNLIGVVFLDLDSFKNVNDTMGHHFGDKVLIQIGDRIKKSLRRTDVISRFGGDEFLIMLNDVYASEDIETVVDKIIRQFEEPLIIDGQETYLTASIGIAIFPKNGQNKDALIKNADIAMYSAKSNGKNQFVFCSEKMEEEMQRTMTLTQNLYHALENDELYIVYQPQVSLIDEKVIAVEALARWNNPTLGPISPQIFIAIAENNGLINDIGKWVLKGACKQNKLWQEMGLAPVRMAVNVSVKQLLNSQFVNTVIQVLDETRLDPQYLELEVTENIAIQESEYMIGVLSRLKALGISLAIDDFGMEYSSLSRIKLLPIDRIKIDMHFISGIQNSQKDRAIVDVIIRLAKELKLSVIAEGVEKEEELQYLKTKLCDEVQGYYFYKPLAKEDVQKLLKDF